MKRKRPQKRQGMAAREFRRALREMREEVDRAAEEWRKRSNAAIGHMLLLADAIDDANQRQN